MISGRAQSDEEKARVAERILAAWRKRPTLRFGQFIDNVILYTKPGDGSLFNVEDEALARACERFATEWP